VAASKYEAVLGFVVVAFSVVMVSIFLVNLWEKGDFGRAWRGGGRKIRIEALMTG